MVFEDDCNFKPYFEVLQMCYYPIHSLTSRVSTALVVKEAISMILGKINSQPIEVAREISIVIHGKQCVNKNTCYFKGIFILLEGF